MTKIFMIACEPSGDSHGAHLAEELRRLEPTLQLRGLGGPKMARAGVEVLEDMTQIAALGFGDVLRLYFQFRKIFYRALAEIFKWKPDTIVLIDSPAFNLRLAKKIRKRFPVIYYVSPQIWAWGGRRIHTIKKVVSKMLTILPFEVPLYEKAGIPVEFVGHPLLDEIEVAESRQALRGELGIPEKEPAIGILPGSRESEVKRILPVMLRSAALLQKKIPQAGFFMTLAPNVKHEVYEKILKKFPDLNIRRSAITVHHLIAAMDFAFITSGTTTLEATLIGTPYFLFYKASWSTYWLGKSLIKVPYLGLANLLADKRVVPEFIQDIHPETVAHEAQVLLENREFYDTMKFEFQKVRAKLGEQGASRRAADAVLKQTDLVSFGSPHQ